MAAIYANTVGGQVSDNPLLIGATTLNSAALADLPAVAAPDWMWLVLDADGSAGDPEIVKVTAHTASATSATIERGAQSSTARQHALNTDWVHAFTKADADDLPHRLLTTTGDLVYASAANTSARLAIGASTTVLHGGTTPSYSQIVAGDIASDAVTTAKILNSNVTTAKIADKAVTGPKMLPAVCQVYDAAQSLTDNAGAAIIFDGADELDALGWHDPGGANPTRVVPTIAGWYKATAVGRLTTTTTTVVRFQVWVAKNGTPVNPGVWDVSPSSTSHRPFGMSGGTLISMNGTTDYLEMFALQDDSGGTARAVESQFLVELVYPT